MNHHSFKIISIDDKPLKQQRYGAVCITGFRQIFGLVHTFYRTQQGAFAIVFAFLFFAMFAMLAFGIEGPRYVYQKARLSDTLEQAAVALTVADNSADRGNNDKNRALVSDYIRTYLPGSGIDNRSLDIIRQVIASGVKYRVEAGIWQDSWLSSLSFPSFSAVVSTGGNAGAQKSTTIVSTMPATDVVFVADFSSTMMQDIENGKTRIEALKEIVLDLAGEFYKHNKNNRLGFIPFSTGVKSFDRKRCIMPFYTNIPINDPRNMNSQFKHAFHRRLESEGKPIEEYDKRKHMYTISSVIEKAINIGSTLESIPYLIDEAHSVSMPIESVGDMLCVNMDTGTRYETYSLPLTSDKEAFKNIENMQPGGDTLISSGVLMAAQHLHQHSTSRKILVMISDGDDSYEEVTKSLIEQGMCEEIKSDNIEMKFIGIQYTPKFPWRDRCVGKNNYYTPDNYQTLRDSLFNAVMGNDSEETGRNIPSSIPSR